MVKTASIRLYFLVQGKSKRAKLPCKDPAIFYTLCVRAILTSAVPVFHLRTAIVLTAWTRESAGECPRKSIISYLRRFRLQRGTKCNRYSNCYFIQWRYLQQNLLTRLLLTKGIDLTSCYLPSALTRIPQGKISALQFPSGVPIVFTFSCWKNNVLSTTE